MLKIEVIKFEAQDVITASVATSVPSTPLVPAEHICKIPGCRWNELIGVHSYEDHQARPW